MYVFPFIFYSNTAYVIHNLILFSKNGDTIYIEQNAQLCVCICMYSYTPVYTIQMKMKNIPAPRKLPLVLPS